jgi:hypothetical protein
MNDYPMSPEGEYVPPELNETAHKIFVAIGENKKADKKLLKAIHVMADAAEAALKDDPELAYLFVEGDFKRDVRLTAVLPIECERLMAYFWSMSEPNQKNLWWRGK